MTLASPCTGKEQEARYLEAEERCEKISPLRLMAALGVARFSRLSDFAISIKSDDEPRGRSHVCERPYHATIAPAPLWMTFTMMRSLHLRARSRCR